MGPPDVDMRIFFLHPSAFRDFPWKNEGTEFLTQVFTMIQNRQHAFNERRGRVIMITDSVDCKLVIGHSYL